MASRQYKNDSKTAAEGEIFIDFSFVTNGASNPTTLYSADGTSLRGLGVGSIVHTATGKYTVVLSDNFRWAIGVYPELEASAAGDGAFATATAPTNSGTTLPLTFIVFTHSAAGALTDFTGRRVAVSVIAKNSLVGV